MTGEMRKSGAAIGLAIAILLIAAHAYSQQSENWNRCANKNGNLPIDLRIAACTTLIASGKEARRDLARAYNYRGFAYLEKENQDPVIAGLTEAVKQAIADFSEAIRLEPKDPGNFVGRGQSYSLTWDYDQAIADLNQAIRLSPKSFEAFYHRGSAYLSKHEYNRAIADLDETIRLNPKFAGTFNARGNAYRGKREYDRAAADYEQAIRLDPDVAKTLIDLAAVYRRLGRDADAIPVLERALAIRKQKLGPGDREHDSTLSALVDARIAVRWAATCEPVKTRALSLLRSAGKTTDTFNQALRALLEIDEQLPNACPFPIQIFSGSIEQIVHCPYNKTIYVMLTDGTELILGESTNILDYGRPQKTSEFIMGITDQPYYCIARIEPLTIYSGQNVQALARRGHDVGDFGLAIANQASTSTRERVNFERRIRRFDEEIRLYPDNPSTFEARGQAYYEKKEYDHAIADYTEAIRLNPKSISAFYGRGRAFGAKKDFAKAIADYSESIRQVSLNVSRPGHLPEDDFIERGLAYIETGAFDSAIADFDEAIKLKPEKYSAWNGRCWARAIVGRDLKRALTDCNEALRLNPNEAPVLDSRGFTYLRLGDIDKAIADYDTALKLNPKQAESLYGRGLAKRKKGDIAGAEADIAAAKTLQKDIADQFARYGVK